MTLKTLLTSFLLGLSLYSFGQKTVALNEPERSFKSAVELYNKQLYNQAINHFRDVQSQIKEANTQAEIAYYIASSKLYLKHQNALNRSRFHHTIVNIHHFLHSSGTLLNKFFFVCI